MREKKREARKEGTREEGREGGREVRRERGDINVYTQVEAWELPWMLLPALHLA